MSKLRTPAIFEIEGTAFEVDIERQMLRQTNDQNNRISFVHDMQDFGRYYHLLFNTESRRPELYCSDEQKIKTIQVPQMTALDPEGMALKYKQPIEALKEKSDLEVIVDQEALGLRRKGVLPQIEIAGEQFIIDLRLNELRHTPDFTPVINLLQFTISEENQTLNAYYHPLLKMPVEIDPKLLEMPDHIVKVSIPNELVLDPVAAAAIYGIDERKLLRFNGMQLHQKAEVIPLSETEIPRMIRQNKEQLQRDHHENMQKIRPRNRYRF